MSVPVASGIWRRSHRADPPARWLADRHYSRQKPGSPQFMPAGSCRVLVARNNKAVFGLSFPKAEFVKHAWAGAWIISIFRNEQAGPLASEMIRDAMAIMQTEACVGAIMSDAARPAKRPAPAHREESAA